MNVVRDRIRELRRVPAGSLRPNPRNWRKHPAEQRAAMRHVLNDVGYADALVARELPDGSLELLDGHLRAETTPDVVVPVLVVDLDDREAALLLATHDPLAAMAETDEAMLRDLLQTLDAASAELQTVFARLIDEAVETSTTADPPPPMLPELYQIVVECRDETEQRDVFRRLVQEGRNVRLQVL